MKKKFFLSCCLFLFCSATVYALPFYSITGGLERTFTHDNTNGVIPEGMEYTGFINAPFNNFVLGIYNSVDHMYFKPLFKNGVSDGNPTDGGLYMDMMYGGQRVFGSEQVYNHDDSMKNPVGSFLIRMTDFLDPNSGKAIQTLVDGMATSPNAIGFDWAAIPIDDHNILNSVTNPDGRGWSFVMGDRPVGVPGTIFIPEPDILALFGLGLLGLVTTRWNFVRARSLA